MFENVVISLPLLGAIIAGIVQGVKRIVGEEKMKRYNVLLAIVLGISFSFLTYYNEQLMVIIGAGLMAGLGATGFYEFGKHIKK